MECLLIGRCFTVSVQLSPQQYHSIEKKMEAQRGKVTFPGSHSWLVPEPRSEPSLWDVRMHSLATFPYSLLTLKQRASAGSRHRASCGPQIQWLSAAFPYVINCPPDLASMGVSVIVKRAIKNSIIGRQRRLPAQPALRSGVPVTWV